MTITLTDPPAVARGLRRDRRRGRARIGVLAASVAVVAVVAVGIGPVVIEPATVARVLAHHLFGVPLPAGIDDIAQQIVWGTRAPRVAMAIVAGAGLALAGAVLQALVRNDLADPYLMGVNAGASTGVALMVLVIGGASGLLLSGAALLGAVAATALVVVIAGTARTRGPFRLVLAGLAVGYALNAATSFLLFWSDSPEAARSVLFWLLGSLATVQPPVLVAAAMGVAVAAVVFTSLGPRIDALASGDDSALAAGIDPETWRFGAMAAASALVGLVVAGVGGVGFIGLVVPHLARAIVGGRSRLVLPASAALGAGLLVLADTVARTALSPQEIPVGVVTGVIGAPFLLFLLRRSGRAGD